MNRATLLGHVGKDPEIRTTTGGKKVASFTLATSQRWKDRESGEQKDKTHWHNIVVWNEGLVGVVERFVKKGSKLLVEGEIQTRDYEKDGTKRYATEIVLQGYDATLTMLDGPKQNAEPVNTNDEPRRNPPPKSGGSFNKTLDDEIPFTAEFR